MNEEQLEARMAEIDAALEGVPGEARGAVYEVYGKLLGEHVTALNSLAEVETNPKGPDELTKESILAIADPDKRMEAIRENPEIMSASKKYQSKAEIMSIHDGAERLKAIKENPQFFQTNKSSSEQVLNPQFQ